MTEKTKKWADNLRVGRISRPQAWLALTCTIWKTLVYPLPAMTLSKRQCEAIMRPAVQQGLRSAGIVSSMPRAIVFGPLKYQGLGLKHLYTLQGIAHLKDLITRCHTPSITGALHRASYEQMALEAGIGEDFLRHNFSKCRYSVTAGLAQHTWQFLSEHRIRVRPQGLKVPLRR